MTDREFGAHCLERQRQCWGRSEPSVIEAVGNGGEAERAGRVRRGGDDQAGGDDRGDEAVAREALAELEHRLGVAQRN